MTFYPNSVAHSLYTTLASDAVLVSSRVTVQLHEAFNSDINLNPWVGVYLGPATADPDRITMQGMQNRRIFYELEVYVQANDFGGGQPAMDRLMRTLTPVMTAVLSNDTLDGTVNGIDEITVEAFQADIQQENSLFTDLITLRAWTYL